MFYEKKVVKTIVLIQIKNENYMVVSHTQLD